jgi:hypothetical protein
MRARSHLSTVNINPKELWILRTMDMSNDKMDNHKAQKILSH